MNKKAKKLKKIILIALGFVLLAFGVVGVIFPLLPTTPFVIFAAICFSGANKNLYEKLKRNRIFGPYIENYRSKKGISRFHKFASIAFLWVGLIISMIINKTTAAFIILCILGAAITIHILLIKNKNSK